MVASCDTERRSTEAAVTTKEGLASVEDESWKKLAGTPNARVSNEAAEEGDASWDNGESSTTGLSPDFLRLKILRFENELKVIGLRDTRARRDLPSAFDSIVEECVV